MMGNFWIGVTDNDWFDVVSHVPGIDEVNFWQPGGGSKAFRVLQPGEPFFFKLHSPLNYIAGGGYFLKQTTLPISLAWEAFDIKNGARSFSEMRALIVKRRRGSPDSRDDFTIGCILLTQPFFFDRSEWLPVPADWQPAIQQGKHYTTTEEPGKSFWERVQVRLAKLPGYMIPEQRIDEQARYGKEMLVRPRLGQGTFRIVVTDAYHRACAITEEHSLPALEASHIRPFNESGPHAVNNGLLLRSDFHRLFDRGYITVTPEYKIVVSGRLKEEFENGRSYYPFHGKPLGHLPALPEDRPNNELLIWHNDNIYRA
jgi:putative restriction endonuclease